MDQLDKIITCYTKLQTLTEEEKTEFFRELQDEDPNLFVQLQEILQNENDALSFFDEFEKDLKLSLADISQPQTYHHIGPYKIIDKIGSGGMANVYRAERTDGVFQRQSAIKLIKRGIDTDEVIKRFRYERNILANLNHDNIGQIYDGGVTDEGLPYFVMEYIPGSDIITFCQQHQISFKDRINLFLQVCDAVDFAHKQLVIHRDIKPGNILVNEEGKVKLTDFGIAKLLNEDTEAITKVFSRAMTREYASPEQIKGEYINTTTDVYQLGLLLYELITEKKPWNKNKGKHEFSFTQKIIPAELKTIIKTATNEEQELRYSTVNALQKDIINFQQNRPLEAKGKTNWYVFKKFLQRNKNLVIASGIVLVLLFTGLVKYISDINEARLKADYRTIQANSIADFYLSSFTRQYPTEANGDTLNVFELLESIENILDKEPDAMAIINDQAFNFRFYYLLGDIYSGWDNYAKALNSYRKAAKIWENKEDNLSDELYSYNEINIYTPIGTCYLRLGKFDSSIYYFRKSLEVPGNKFILNDLSGLAYNYWLMGDYQLADSTYKLLEKELQNGNVKEGDLIVYAIALSRLGQYLTNQYLGNRNDEIDSIFKKSLSIFERQEVFPERPNYEVFRKNKIKREYIKVGAKYKYASPGGYAEVLNSHGMFHYFNNAYDSALHYFKKSYEANLYYFGKNNRKSLDNLNNIAAIQRKTGKVKEALISFKKCWNMSQQNQFLHPSLTLNYFQNYASCYYDLEEYEICIYTLDTLLQLKQKYTPNDHYSINLAKITLADCYRKKEQLTKSLKMYDEIIESHNEYFGDKGDTDLKAAMKKMLVFAKLAEPKKMKNIYEKNANDISNRFSKQNSLHNQNHFTFSKALYLSNSYEEAESMIKNAIDQINDDTQLFLYQALLAEVYLATGRNSPAKQIMEELKQEDLQNLNKLKALQKLEEKIAPNDLF